MKLNLEPKRVFEIFEEIASIPHGSFNTDEIAEYCLTFAKNNHLEAYKDQGGNVIIIKEATRGYENKEPIILQGHIDMVCEKEEDCDIDMAKDGLTLESDGLKIWAKGTTLGADNGIAVAYALAILESSDLKHPRIEAVLTNNEEVGMLGARNLDITHIKGRRMINMDSEEEGIFTVSCAGAVRTYVTIPYETTLCNKEAVRIRIGGLKGGHSGVEIHKHRENAICILARVLNKIWTKEEFCLVDVHSGGRVNVIPSSAEAIVCVEDYASVSEAINEVFISLTKECETTDKEVYMECETIDYTGDCCTKDSTKNLIYALYNMPNGVIKMNPDMEDMVRTSLNAGEAIFKDGCLKISYLVRSNLNCEKESLKERIVSFFTYIGGDVRFESDYSAWAYKPHSPLRDTMVEVYKTQYGKDPIISSIHAGLECGIISGIIGDADMISFGPNLSGVHTPKETMEIASVQRCWEYLVSVLENL